MEGESMSECCGMHEENVKLAAEVERLEKERVILCNKQRLEVEALRKRIEDLEAEKREMDEQVRKHARCINGLRHTIDIYQEAITSQAVAMSLLIEEDPVGE